MSDSPPLFRRPATLEWLEQIHKDTAVERMGIEFTQVGPDRLVARMPVDARTKQPMGILHGGVSVVLAETLGSRTASLTLPPDRYAVGLDINANHIRAVKPAGSAGPKTVMRRIDDAGRKR
jgi:1,4-dihydroxy-2-naphthoyl-CoA hydrolase